jgi:hypothetical protein
MIDLSQLRLLVIRPTLYSLASGGISYSLAAENLILGTGLHESNYQYLAQIDGPALGFWQMEPATFMDCWTNYINYRVPLRMAMLGLCGSVYPEPQALVTNLALACAMARVKYARSPEPLPDAEDAGAQSAYYKQWYNSSEGAATMAQVLPAFQTAAA